MIALCSAKGSPGVTLAGQVLASVWPRPVALVDADPAGGDILWRCRTPQGGPLNPDHGLLSLAAAARRDADETNLSEHLQQTNLGQSVLVGLSSQEQLTGLGSVWTQLPSLLARHTEDVLVDCGQLSAGSAALPVIHKADAVLVVVRPDMEGVAHLRSRLFQFGKSLRMGDADGTPVLIAVATTYRDTQSATHLQQLLDSEGIPARVVGVFAEDAKGAGIFTSTRAGAPGRTLLARSARVIAQALVSVPSVEQRIGMV
ncbi:hypothetical protein ASD66_20490 [Nocardioides sp. Root151]|nr:hypothetical protein ASD30_07215 [Nocardioides sp. Root140]KQZ67334.1 hypothetical protein ASD66_20490 [Nocardioides sp. Root151]KRF12588.1 hypothetical protein ASH02_13570 [Nocardioides sp. Soil796]